MEITYSLEKRDFLTYQLFAASKSERIAEKRRRNWLIFPAIYFLLGLYFYFSMDRMLGGAFAAMAVLWLAFYPNYERKRYKSHYEKYIDENYQNRFGRPASLAIEEDYMFSHDHASESRFKHSEIAELYEIRDYLYVKLSTGVSLILPNSRITDFEPFKEALLEITDKLGVEHITEMDWKWA